VLDEDFVARVYEGSDTGGGYAYAALVVFHFLGNADDHCRYSLLMLVDCDCIRL
jgi:hypothetical protein